MKHELVKRQIIEAVEQHYSSDDSLLDLITESVVEADQAKQRLREAGFGVSGVSLLRTVEEVLQRFNIGDGLDGY